MKSLYKLLLIISIACFSVSCTMNSDEMTAELENSAVGQVYEMKSDFVNTKTVTLYYPDPSNGNLLRIVKEVNIFQSSSLIKEIADKLLNYTLNEDDNFIVPFDGKVYADWIIVSKNLATVNLNGDFTIFTEKQIFAGIVSIVNTLCEINSIDYVEILCNGKQFKNRGLLVNPMSQMDSSIHLRYLDHINIIDSEERKMTRDKSILYFLDRNSNFLIAEIGNASVNKENAAEDLFRLLKNEPYYGSGLKSSIPQNVLMPSSAVVSIENELNVLTIRLESPKYETMDNKTRYMMCGSITLTLLSYFDNINALRILLNGEPALEEILLTKEMFIENVGQMVTVYLPNKDLNYLTKINFAMSQTRYTSPKERVKEIIFADEDYKANTAKIIPENVVESDILNVFVHDTCCVVDISYDLYTNISGLSYSNRKMFLYSIVNTLTEFENINSVQFLVDGVITEKLGEKLYIETPMLNNPGIVYD